MMKLTKKQKEALESAPLHFGQSEVNLNRFYWSNNDCSKSFQPRTINILIEKGLLTYESKAFGGVDYSTLIRVS